MMGAKTTARVHAIMLASTFAPLIAFLVYGYSHRWTVVVPIFLALWLGFYQAGLWSSERTEEFKKLPISSHELRRRKKEFYDWLASQNRRSKN